MRRLEINRVESIDRDYLEDVQFDPLKAEDNLFDPGEEIGVSLGISKITVSSSMPSLSAPSSPSLIFMELASSLSRRGETNEENSNERLFMRHSTDTNILQDFAELRRLNQFKTVGIVRHQELERESSELDDAPIHRQTNNFFPEHLRQFEDPVSQESDLMQWGWLKKESLPLNQRLHYSLDSGMKLRLQQRNEYSSIDALVSELNPPEVSSSDSQLFSRRNVMIEELEEDFGLLNSRAKVQKQSKDDHFSRPLFSPTAPFTEPESIDSNNSSLERDVEYSSFKYFQSNFHKSQPSANFQREEANDLAFPPGFSERILSRPQPESNVSHPIPSRNQHVADAAHRFLRQPQHPRNVMNTKTYSSHPTDPRADYDAKDRYQLGRLQAWSTSNNNQYFADDETTQRTSAQRDDGSPHHIPRRPKSRPILGKKIPSQVIALLERHDDDEDFPEMLPAKPQRQSKELTNNRIETRDLLNRGGSLPASAAIDASKRFESPLTSSFSQDTGNSDQLEAAKAVVKRFFKEYRACERDSAERAEAYALNSLEWIPPSELWRVHLELAEISKKKNDLQEARRYFAMVCSSQAQSSQGWLEWSKMEEDSGFLERALRVLRAGLQTGFSELLLTRAVKIHERLDKLQECRELLGQLRNQPMEKAWRVVFEGALLEARVGNVPVARRLFQFLMANVSWYGPIYHEAFKLEERLENDVSGLRIVETGLKALPRYGPLWFGLLRISERSDAARRKSWSYANSTTYLRQTREDAARAVESISRELIWKVYFELAQAEERAVEVAAKCLHASSTRSLLRARNELLGNARTALIKSFLSSPKNLRWKVWLYGARLELFAGYLPRARKLLCEAFNEVPQKSKAHVLLECCRLEEFAGNFCGAALILSKACNDFKYEWKLFLEAVLFEARTGNIKSALKTAAYALDYHPATGRLWATFIQLCHRSEIYCVESAEETEDSRIFPCLRFESTIQTTDKEVALYRAIGHVPKSGEVWCEGARCRMNPMLPEWFDLQEAHRRLGFAIQFTPQYGDSFVEYIRLELMCQVFVPIVLAEMMMSREERMATFEEIMLVDKGSDSYSRYIQGSVNFDMVQYKQDILGLRDALRKISLDNLFQRCVNADPNYGSIWYNARSTTVQPAIQVLRDSHRLLVHEMLSASEVYLQAVRIYILRFRKSNVMFKEFAPESEGVAVAMPNRYPSRAVLRNKEGDLYCVEDFITGLVSYNRLAFKANPTLDERMKNIFGSDQILS